MASMVELFRELQRYVGFGPADEARLRSLLPVLEPSFDEVVEAFYARILEHEDARAALVRGERHVGQLKVTLRRWLGELLTGPWDDAYVQRRARIGRVHVQISLPQHYMVSAMNLVRVKLLGRVRELVPEANDCNALRDSLQRVLDLDLALMLHTYREDLESRNSRAERLATFGQLVGSIGHELRNPLGVIETSLYVLKSRPTPEDPRVTKHLDRISQQVVLANDIITQLLDLIRERPLARQPVPVGHLLADVVGTVRAPTGVAFSLAGEKEDWTVEGDPTQLRQVLANLVENAVHAASPIGAVKCVVQPPTATHLVVTVEDTGPGIDPSVRNRLFEPLVTTKQRGIGLGLALVRRILERHQGSIEAGRSALGGARFTVTLPLVQAHDATAPSAADRTQMESQ